MRLASRHHALPRSCVDGIRARGAQLVKSPRLQKVHNSAVVALPDAKAQRLTAANSIPRHGGLLHPSSWAERDDRDHAADNFFQGGSPKQATPLTAPATPLTTKNRFTPNFRG